MGEARTTPDTAWLSQYQALAQLAYTVRHLCPRLPVLGIAVLHPRHPIPPDHLQLLNVLARDGVGTSARATRRPSLPPLLRLVTRWLWCLLFALRDSLKILWLNMRFGGTLRRLMSKPAAVILKTWRFSAQAANGATDFYYGSLPAKLEERGIPCLLLCGDARGLIDSAFTNAALKPEGSRTVPEQLLVPIWAPLLTVCQQLSVGLALQRLARALKDKPLAAVCASAALGSVHPSTLRNTVMFYIARSAVKTWRPRVFVTLYEGQPWELPARHGAKAADPSCVTVGYQHTVIMPHSFSLRWPNHGSWELSTPDVVLCLSERTGNMLRAGCEPHRTKLISFGSFRRASDEALPSPPKPGLRTVLVVPESGVIWEAQLLFHFAMRSAALLPDHRFIFRCHPVMPFARILPSLDWDPRELSTIEVSDQPIGMDLARSSAVLYRGSSSVLYAVLHGLKPIYLHDEHHLDVDPLFELTNWREYVSTPEELEHLLRRYAMTADDLAAEQSRNAVAYVHDYTRPVTEASLDQFLEVVGLR